MPKTPAWCIFNYSFLTCGFARWLFGCASHLPAFAGLHHMARGRRDYVAFARIGTARLGHPGRNKHAGVANTLPRLQREYAALARIGPRVGISMLVARTRSRSCGARTWRERALGRREAPPVGISMLVARTRSRARGATTWRARAPWDGAPAPYGRN